MELRVRYRAAASELIRDVRMFTIYPHNNGSAKPELVIHFKLKTGKSQRNIQLKGIQDVIVLDNEQE